MLDISYMYVPWYLLYISCLGSVLTMVPAWAGTVMPVRRQAVMFGFGFVLLFSPFLFFLGGGNISESLLEASCTCDVFQGRSHSLSIVEQVLDIVFARAYFETHGVSLSGEGGAY